MAASTEECPFSMAHAGLCGRTSTLFLLASLASVFVSYSVSSPLGWHTREYQHQLQIRRLIVLLYSMRVMRDAAPCGSFLAMDQSPVGSDKHRFSCRDWQGL